MDGTVTVAAAGTAYPQDQAAVTAANQAAEAADIATGHALEASFSPSTTTNSDGSKTYHLAAGVGSERHLDPALHLVDPGRPRRRHRRVDQLATPTASRTRSPSGPSRRTIPSWHRPVARPTRAPAGSAPGLYVGPPIPAPHSYSLTFTKAGTFPYICVLHDVVGMTGSITVAAATGSGPTPPPTSTQPLAPPSGSGDASLALLGPGGVRGTAWSTHRHSPAGPRRLSSDPFGSHPPSGG